MDCSRVSSQTPTYRSLSADDRRQTLRHLQDLLIKPDPITHSLLSDWASQSDSRAAVLVGGVWGGVHWPKGLGRPKTASITGAIEVVHEYRKVQLVDLGGGHVKDIGPWIVQRRPSLWDASTETHFRVGFFFFAGGGGINPNRLTVSLAHVSWQLTPFMSPGTLSLDPHGYGDFGNLGERVVMPDFEIRHHPYSLTRSIRPLGPIKDAGLYRQPDFAYAAAAVG